ncbi:MAG TPA: RES family NAD+ phosphorylase [Longimicrobiaceae bacterium]|nr:RES family NAD+ phosphorylase [Longimicrobiaceae bacterium]
MTFTGRVWRHVPRGAHPLDFSHLINANGRWNRANLYGCLYTALTPEGAVAEYRKHHLRRGLQGARDLVSLSVRVDHVLDLAGLMEDVDAGRRQVPVPGRLRGRASALRSLPDIDPTSLTGDRPADLEHCRQVADWARRMGFLAIRAASAALTGAVTLSIYPENRPGEIQLAVEGKATPLNYGPEPLA